MKNIKWILVLCMCFLVVSSKISHAYGTYPWTLNSSGQTWNVRYSGKESFGGWTNDVYKCDRTWSNVIRFSLKYKIEETSKSPFLDEYYVLWIHDGKEWMRTNGVDQVFMTGKYYNFEAKFPEPTRVTKFAIVPLEKHMNDDNKYSWNYEMTTGEVQTGEDGINAKRYADVVFILDESGSMGGYVRSVGNNMNRFATSIINEGIDLNYFYWGGGSENVIGSSLGAIRSGRLRLGTSNVYIVTATDETLVRRDSAINGGGPNSDYGEMDKLKGELKDKNITYIGLGDMYSNRELAKASGGISLSLSSDLTSQMSLIARKIIGKPIVSSPESVGSEWEFKGEYWDFIDIMGSVSYPDSTGITIKYSIENMSGTALQTGTVESGIVSNGKNIFFMKKGVDISSLPKGQFYNLKVYTQLSNGTVSSPEIVKFKREDKKAPIINFEVPTNSEPTYEATINIMVKDGQSGISYYKYGWLQEKLVEPINHTQLSGLLGNQNKKSFSGKVYTDIETLKFRRSGEWYLYVQAIDNKGNIRSKRLDKILQIDTLAPKTPTIDIDINDDASTPNIQLKWSKFEEYSQKLLDKASKGEGVELVLDNGDVIILKTEGQIKNMVSGFGEGRVYLQYWTKLDNWNYGWDNILKYREYIKINDINQLSRIVTNSDLKKPIDKDGTRYRVKIRYIDKAGMKYVKDYRIIDSWNPFSGSFKYNIIDDFKKVNMENIGNMSDSGWEETFADIGAVNLKYSTKPLSWDREAGRGIIKLFWDPVKGANGYYVDIFNGNIWERYYNGSETKWSSYVARIYPKEELLDRLGNDSIKYEIFNHNLWDRYYSLRDNPIKLYQKTAGELYDNKTTYRVRVVPIILENFNGREVKIEGAVGEESMKDIQLENRTDLLNPTANIIIEYPTEYKYKKAIIRITGIDEESGMKSIMNLDESAYKIAENTYGKNKIAAYEVHDNGNYKFKLIDKVGRETIVTARVTNINPNKPIIIFKRGTKVITEVHLENETANYKFIKYGVANVKPEDRDDVVANKNFEGFVEIGLELPTNQTEEVSKAGVERPYFIKFIDSSGKELIKGYSIKITIDDEVTIKEIQN